MNIRSNTDGSRIRNCSKILLENCNSHHQINGFLLKLPVLNRIIYDDFNIKLLFWFRNGEFRLTVHTLVSRMNSENFPFSFLVSIWDSAKNLKNLNET